MLNIRSLLALLVVLVYLAGCSVARLPPRPPVKRPPAAPLVQYGWASWYGREFHGRPTSGGEIYDMYQLTAAHRTLPLGTRVMVTHMKTGRSVLVRINDRGPFVEGRIIDLSYAAARNLDMINEGVIWAKVEVLGENLPQTLPVGGPYAVQVGSFASRDNARKLAHTLKRSYQGVYIAVMETRSATYYRVRMGKFRTRQEAEDVARRLVKAGYSPLITETH